jgi:hypothetical protein
MVGASEEALNFIQEFTARRFPPKVEKPVKPPQPKVTTPKQTASPSTSSIPNTQSEGVFPSLPANQQPYETMWPANINIQYKKEDDYFSG